MILNQKYNKNSESTLTHTEWNELMTDLQNSVSTSEALNNNYIETSLSAKNNLKISAAGTYKIVEVEGETAQNPLTFSISDINASYSKEALKEIVDGNANKLSDLVYTGTLFAITGQDNKLFKLSSDVAPKISIESEEEVDLDAKYGDVVLTSGDCIKCEAPEIRLNAINSDKTGGMVNFGATQDVIFITKKLTSGMKVEAPTTPTKIKQVLQNNTTQEVLWDGSRFMITLQELYGKDGNNELVKVTPDNYNTYKETNAFFSDGSAVPADYTCYCGFTTEDNGTYTTVIYMWGTKGSAPQFKKKVGKPVATYTHSSADYLGGYDRIVAVDDQDPTYDFVKGMDYLEFIFPSEEAEWREIYDVVQPNSFVESEELSINLEDVITSSKGIKRNSGLKSEAFKLSEQITRETGGINNKKTVLKLYPQFKCVPWNNTSELINLSNGGQPASLQINKTYTFEDLNFESGDFQGINTTSLDTIQQGLKSGETKYYAFQNYNVGFKPFLHSGELIINSDADLNINVPKINYDPNTVLQVIEDLNTQYNIPIIDILKLVEFFKTGAGQANGPWSQQ